MGRSKGGFLIKWGWQRSSCGSTKMIGSSKYQSKSRVISGMCWFYLQTLPFWLQFYHIWLYERERERAGPCMYSHTHTPPASVNVMSDANQNLLIPCCRSINMENGGWGIESFSTFPFQPIWLTNPEFCSFFFLIESGKLIKHLSYCPMMAWFHMH